MGNTKKVRTAGRFGSRYGVGVRKRLLKVEDKQEKNYACPFCGFKKVKRKAAGLYACGKCHARFAGGAYLPITLSGSIIKKTVAQKAFVSKNKALDEIIKTASEENKQEIEQVKKTEKIDKKEEKKKTEDRKNKKEEKKKTEDRKNKKEEKKKKEVRKNKKEEK